MVRYDEREEPISVNSALAIITSSAFGRIAPMERFRIT